MTRLSIIIPCYQNEENIPDLVDALNELVDELIDSSIQVVFVDDGSTDNTLRKILDSKDLINAESLVVQLTGNFGSYNAFLAGLNYATGDYYVQLHADLQDPPKHIPQMLKTAEKGFKLVIGLRTNREEPWLSKILSDLYHKMVKSIALQHVPEGGYDLILFDKSIRDAVVQMNENNINLVYLISSLKHPYAVVPVTRLERRKGKSQWSFSKKRKLWIDTVVGFSYSPIKWLSNLVLLLLLLNVLFLIANWIWSLSSVSSKLLVTFIFANLQLMLTGLAIIAEYLWRTLEASRNRPPFVVDKVFGHPSGNN